MICSRNPTNSFCNCWRGFSLCWCTQCFFYHKLSFTATFLLSTVFFFSSGFIFWSSLLFNTNWTVHFSPALGFQICGSSVTYNRCFITQWYSQVQVLRLYSSAAWCPVSWVVVFAPLAPLHLQSISDAHAIFIPTVLFISKMCITTEDHKICNKVSFS